MKSSLDHLPQSKRQELARAVEILFAEFEDALVGATQDYKRQGRILKIILFGSYARGNWVSDPVGGYVSDYDLLVVVNHEKLTGILDYWAKAEEHLLIEYSVHHRLSAPVNFIVHSFTDINKRLRLGRYFFTDLIRDGIALYQAPGYAFDRPKVLSQPELIRETREYFHEWIAKAESAIKGARFYVAENESKDAAFLLHQTTERLYHCMLLVFTLYSPKSHRLNFLRSQAEQLDSRLAAAWPRETKFQQRCFELLRRAYVDARYSPQFKITPEELAWLGERIALLHSLVRAVCEEHLKRLGEQP